MSLQRGDMKAAFTGLVLGAIVLFGIVVTIVKFTNQHYTREASAETTR
jgi:hypothetical protein